MQRCERYRLYAALGLSTVLVWAFGGLQCVSASAC
jgi:hypothetical protein